MDDILNEEAKERLVLNEWGEFRDRNPEWLNQTINNLYKKYMEVSDPRSEKYNPGNKKYFVEMPRVFYHYDRMTGKTETSNEFKDRMTGLTMRINSKIRRKIADTLMEYAHGVIITDPNNPNKKIYTGKDQQGRPVTPRQTPFGDLEELTFKAAMAYAYKIIKSFIKYSNRAVYRFHPHHFADPYFIKMHEDEFIQGLDNRFR